MAGNAGRVRWTRKEHEPGPPDPRPAGRTFPIGPGATRPVPVSTDRTTATFALDGLLSAVPEATGDG